MAKVEFRLRNAQHTQQLLTKKCYSNKNKNNNNGNNQKEHKKQLIIINVLSHLLPGSCVAFIVAVDGRWMLLLLDDSFATWLATTTACNSLLVLTDNGCRTSNAGEKFLLLLHSVRLQLMLMFFCFTSSLFFFWEPHVFTKCSN